MLSPSKSLYLEVLPPPPLNETESHFVALAGLDWNSQCRLKWPQTPLPSGSPSLCLQSARTKDVCTPHTWLMFFPGRLEFLVPPYYISRTLKKSNRIMFNGDFWQLESHTKCVVPLLNPPTPLPPGCLSDWQCSGRFSKEYQPLCLFS